MTFLVNVSLSGFTDDAEDVVHELITVDAAVLFINRLGCLNEAALIGYIVNRASGCIDRLKSAGLICTDSLALLLGTDLFTCIEDHLSEVFGQGLKPVVVCYEHCNARIVTKGGIVLLDFVELAGEGKGGRVILTVDNALLESSVNLGVRHGRCIAPERFKGGDRDRGLLCSYFQTFHIIRSLNGANVVGEVTGAVILEAEDIKTVFDCSADFLNDKGNQRLVCSFPYCFSDKRYLMLLAAEPDKDCAVNIRVCRVLLPRKSRIHSSPVEPIYGFTVCDNICYIFRDFFAEFDLGFLRVKGNMRS